MGHTLDKLAAWKYSSTSTERQILEVELLIGVLKLNKIKFIISLLTLAIEFEKINWKVMTQDCI